MSRILLKVCMKLEIEMDPDFASMININKVNFDI